MRHRTTASIATTLWATAGIAADAPYEPQIFDELEQIVVTATLNERAQKDVANDVTVIAADEIDRRQVQGLADLLRYEPGIGTTGAAIGGGRFGTTGISIRGLGGNRVRLEVDGIAVPDAFEIGSFSSAGRDVVDVDVLKRVEIVRGASSSLYGSDALGGVVSFVTKDPSDFIGVDGGTFASAKFLYDSANRGSAETGIWSGGGSSDGVVVVATHRDASATNNLGEVDSADSTRTRPNPQDIASNALLAKYVHTAESGRIDRVTFDGERAATDTDVLTGRSFSALTQALTTSLRGEDSRERLRFAYEQELPLGNAFADTLDWKVYAQRSETGQDTFEDRVTIGPDGPVNPKQRWRSFTFDQRVFGVEALLHKSIASGNVEHALTWGIDASRTRTEEERDGWQRDVTSGSISNVVSPDTFPVRDFPVSDTTSAALFGQDEMRVGRLSVIPALRVDYYKLDPKPDATFDEDNPGIVPVGLRHTSWSPKLGAIWRFGDRWSAFVQYAHGFRAPPYNDVNIGFTNLAFGYTAVPNPDLKPETSNGAEFGLRADTGALWFSLSAYENRYRDFIESQAFVGFDEQGLVQFQSINVARVRIRGVEARAGLDLAGLCDDLRGWTLKGSFATARGDDRTAEQPLSSIDPERAVVGLAYDRDDWGAELAGTFVGRKDRLAAAEPSLDPSAPPPVPLFRAPGYTMLDLYAHWRPRERIELFGGITNIGDRRYWNWGSVAGFAQSSRIDLYSAPGRAVRVGVRATF